MLMQSPSVEFVVLNGMSIIAETGSGYTLCQKLYGNNVGCKEFGNAAVTVTVLCGEFCDTSSSNPDQESGECDDDVI